MLNIVGPGQGTSGPLPAHSSSSAQAQPADVDFALLVAALLDQPAAGPDAPIAVPPFTPADGAAAAGRPATRTGAEPRSGDAGTGKPHARHRIDGTSGDEWLALTAALLSPAAMPLPDAQPPASPSQSALPGSTSSDPVPLSAGTMPAASPAGGAPETTTAAAITNAMRPLNIPIVPNDAVPDTGAARTALAADLTLPTDVAVRGLEVPREKDSGGRPTPDALPARAVSAVRSDEILRALLERLRGTTTGGAPTVAAPTVVAATVATAAVPPPIENPPPPANAPAAQSPGAFSPQVQSDPTPAAPAPPGSAAQDVHTASVATAVAALAQEDVAARPQTLQAHAGLPEKTPTVGPAAQPGTSAPATISNAAVVAALDDQQPPQPLMDGTEQHVALQVAAGDRPAVGLQTQAVPLQALSAGAGPQEQPRGAATPGSAAVFARAVARLGSNDGVLTPAPTVHRAWAPPGSPIVVAAAGVAEASLDNGAQGLVLPATGGNAPLDDAALEQQVVQAIRLQWQAGVGEATIKLQPDHLGAMTVSLRVEGGAVSADMHVETSAAQAWITSHEVNLRSALERQGLTLDRMVVSQDSSSDRRQQQGQRSPRDRSRRRQDPGQEFEVGA